MYATSPQDMAAMCSITGFDPTKFSYDKLSADDREVFMKESKVFYCIKTTLREVCNKIWSTYENNGGRIRQLEPKVMLREWELKTRVAMYQCAFMWT